MTRHLWIPLLGILALVSATANAQTVAFVTCSSGLPEIATNVEDQLTPHGFTVTTFDDTTAAPLTSYDAVLFAPCGSADSAWGDELAAAPVD